MGRLPGQSKPISYPVKVVQPSPGDITEILSVIQGEGTLIGERHLFIRLAGCPFRCAYCDTPQALVPQPACLVESPPGKRKFRKIPNPIAAAELPALVQPFFAAANVHRAVTLTGGEPLLQAGYLKEVLPSLREMGKRVYLETAGVHVAELRSILDHVDVVAMDVKLPSATGMKPMWAAHRDFLRAALMKHVIIKVVVSRKTLMSELELVRDMVSEIDRTVPVVIQPVTPAWKVKTGASTDQLLTWQALLSEKLNEVRVIPQCHRFLQDR